MNTITDLVRTARYHEGTFLEVTSRTTPYTSREFCTNTWKAGSLLGQYGAHPGAEVAVLVGPKTPADANSRAQAGQFDSADPLLAIVGGMLVGGTVTLAPRSPIAARVLVCPTAWADGIDREPQCTVLAYGDRPASAAVRHFERERWSESPVEPPETVTPDTPALVANGETYSHGAILAAAETATAWLDIDDGCRVGLAADIRDPGAFVAGIVAPLLANATVVVPGTGDDGFDEADVSVLLADDDPAAGPRSHTVPTVEKLLSG